MMKLFLELGLVLIFFTNFILGCSQQQKSNLLVLDGINVAETPSILVEVEALEVPVVLAVSIQDLKNFPTVRLIAKEALLRGHDVILSTDSPLISKETRKEWYDFIGEDVMYTTKSMVYTLDLSPDHITVIPQLVKERIAETPSIGRIIYLNSFVVGAKVKVLSVIQTYQQSGFKFVTLSECLPK